MFPRLSDQRKAAVFVSLVIFLSASLVVLFGSRGPDSEIVVLLNMLTPLVATLLMLYVFTPEGYRLPPGSALGLKRTPWGQLGLPILLPLPILGVSFGLAWIGDVASMSVPADGGPGVDLLINVVMTFVILVPLVLCEEIGFRGYLLPKLQERGSIRALLLSGFLHAVWHLPLILLTSHYLPDGNRFLTIPLFVALLTAAGVIYGTVRMQTGSIWPGTILHAAFNGFLGLFISLTVFDSSSAVYIVGESGVVTVALTAVAALLIWRRLNSPTVAAPSEVHHV